MAKTNPTKEELTALAEKLPASELEATRAFLTGLGDLVIKGPIVLKPVPFNGGSYGYGDVRIEVETPEGKKAWYPVITSPKSEKGTTPRNVALQALANERTEGKAVVASVNSVTAAIGKLSPTELMQVLTANPEAMKLAAQAMIAAAQSGNVEEESEAAG